MDAVIGKTGELLGFDSQVGILNDKFWIFCEFWKCIKKSIKTRYYNSTALAPFYFYLLGMAEGPKLWRDA